VGSNLILVIPPATSVGGIVLAAGSQPCLTPEDVEAIRREVAGIQAVSPSVDTTGHLSYGARNWAPLIIKGQGEEYLQVKAWAIAEGDFFSADDVEAARQVCVLGETVREALFGDEEATGHLVRIGAVPFQVVGVLARRGHAAGGADLDDVVITPWTTVRRTLQGSRFNHVDFLLVSGRDEDSVPGVVRELADLLRDRHPASAENAPEFRIIPMTDVARMAAENAGIMKRFLAVIASISLAVGGVGILNIMLVSVAERTAEIGLRLAVGARSVDILGQFLGEATLMALLAGTAGIALGAGVAVGMGGAFDWPIQLSFRTASLAVLVSGAIGLLSGAYPSVRASRLDPIVALRGH
jgi:putative ABC transport system permease protein